jgi:hypothetical protein
MELSLRLALTTSACPSPSRSAVASPDVLLPTSRKVLGLYVSPVLQRRVQKILATCQVYSVISRADDKDNQFVGFESQ